MAISSNASASEEPTAFVNHRKFRRARVNLPGALCYEDNRIELVRTVDISEGGVAVTLEDAGNRQWALQPGSEIKLQLEGVLSSGPQRNLDIYRMLVVYSSNSRLGLRFQ